MSGNGYLHCEECGEGHSIGPVKADSVLEELEARLVSGVEMAKSYADSVSGGVSITRLDDKPGTEDYFTGWAHACERLLAKLRALRS